MGISYMFERTVAHTWSKRDRLRIC